MRLPAILFFLIFIVSCRPAAYSPKPRGYYHIALPAERNYRLFNEPGFPYRFEYPAYAEIIKDTIFFDQKPENPYWISVDFPTLGGRIYISYKVINSNMDKLAEDTYEMTFFHTKKADYIEDFLVHNDSADVHGIFYSVSGNAASAYQFFATDSSRHYLRGALYFNTTPNADSLKPVNDFIRKDMEHLLQTLRWQ